MPILQVSNQNIAQIRRFFNAARYLYKNFGDEDLASLIQDGIMVLGSDEGLHWGAVGVAFETRPVTLPVDAPNRAFLNAAAFGAGYWPAERLPELMRHVELLLPRTRLPLQISVQAYASWLERALYQVGFELYTQVRAMALEDLKKEDLKKRTKSTTQPDSGKTPAILRLARPADLPTLATVDAAAFEPLWHFSEYQLLELLMRGRLQVAEVGTTLVGYSALLPVNTIEMQLARLAVLPTVQRQGIGRQLLVDSIQYTQAQGCEMLTLNTQTDNVRSQALYQSLGFHFYGEAIPVLMKDYQHV